jgi:hypothetical protein
MRNEEDIFIDHERMYRAFRNDRGEIGIAVLCGGIGLYEVKLLLNEEERREYEAGGRQYLDVLARDVAKNERKYDDRTYG